MAYRPGTRELTNDELELLSELDKAVPRTPKGLRRYKSTEGFELLERIQDLNKNSSVPLEQFAKVLGCSRQAVHYALNNYARV